MEKAKAPRVHKHFVYDLQKTLYGYFSAEELREGSGVSFRLLLEDNTESLIGLLALCQFRSKQPSKFDMRVVFGSGFSNDAYSELFAQISSQVEVIQSDALLREGEIVVPCYSLESSVARFYEYLTSEQKDESENQVAFRRPYKTLHLLSCLTNDQLKAEALRLKIPFIESSVQSVFVARFLGESWKVDGGALTNTRKALYLMQIRSAQQYREAQNVIQLPLTPLESARHVVDKTKLYVVGYSGGKDSSTLLLLLHELGVPCMAVTFDPGLPGFRMPAIRAAYESLQAVAPGLSPLEVIRFPVQHILEEHEIQNACPACARFRRGCLEKFCIEKNATLALGHHLADFTETLLMTSLHSGGFFGMRSQYISQAGVPIARPMIYTSQAAVLEYLSSKGLHPRSFVSSDAAECNLASGIQRQSERRRIRAVVDKFSMQCFAECFLEDVTKGMALGEDQRE